MEKVTGQYLKFMSDIIDSGIWGQLSSAARTLYPVLLKFSDQNFKSVWPSTRTLLKLTGFKSKKSIIEAKKELSTKGLLFFTIGTGRTNSTYFFTFHYREVGQDKPLGCNVPHPSSELCSIHGVVDKDTEGYSKSNSNQINITIHNNPNHELKNDLKLVFGEKIYNKGLENTIKKGFKPSYEILNKECLLLSREPVNDQDKAQHVIDSWRNFLSWSKIFLTLSSSSFFEKLNIQVDGSNIFIKDSLNEFQKQIIEKYFEENVNPKIFVLFNNNHLSV